MTRSPERVFLPGRKDPLVLRQNSAELFLLQRLRDEAHRFAITFHQKLRTERNFRSILEEVPGIGDKRRKALLRHFGSLKKIRAATPEELAQAPGFHLELAQRVHAFLKARGEAELVPLTVPDEGVHEGDDEALVPTGVVEALEELGEGELPDALDAAARAGPPPDAPAQ